VGGVGKNQPRHQLEDVGQGLLPYLPLKKLAAVAPLRQGARTNEKSTLYSAIVFFWAFWASSSVYMWTNVRKCSSCKNLARSQPSKEGPRSRLQDPVHPRGVRYDDRIFRSNTAAIEGHALRDDRRLVWMPFLRLLPASRLVQFRQAVGVGLCLSRRGGPPLRVCLNPQIRAVLGSEGVTSNTSLCRIDRSLLMQRIHSTSAPAGLALASEDARMLRL